MRFLVLTTGVLWGTASLAENRIDFAGKIIEVVVADRIGVAAQAAETQAVTVFGEAGQSQCGRVEQ